MAGDYTPELLELIATRFKVLAEPLRLRLLNSLREAERTVSQLVEETGAGQANVSRHLALLHRHRMVSRRKDGLNVYYRISDPSIFELCELVCGSLHATLADELRPLSERPLSERPLSERQPPSPPRRQ